MSRINIKASLLFFSAVLFFTPVVMATDQCHDPAVVLNPEPLQESWAVDWWIPRHEKKLNEKGRENARLLFLGDSITQGWERAGSEVWEKYYAGYGAYNLGFSGDRTENVLWRLENGQAEGINPEIAVIMIGTNNTGHRQDSPACTATGIEKILDELKKHLPETKILLLAIFPRETSPEHELRKINDEINRNIENLADGDNRITFLNINHAFLDDEGTLSQEIMPDLLHLSELGYRLWAEAMESTLIQLLDD